MALRQRRSGAVACPRASLGLLVVCLVAVAGAVLVPTSSAAGTPMTVQVVVENPDYEILAVDPSGMTYGLSVSSDNGIWRSDDHGSTWAQVLSLPSNQHVKNISALASGTLLAHVDTGEMTRVPLVRPGGHLDAGAGAAAGLADLLHHVDVALHHGGRRLHLARHLQHGPEPAVPELHLPLGRRRGHVVDREHDDDTPAYPRSALQRRQALRLLRGLIRRRDLGVVGQRSHAQPLCTDYACVTIDAAFDPANTFMLFGNDNYVSQNRIVKVALSDGTLTPIMDIPYDSFSTLRLGASTYLVGTTHESGVPIVDPDLHLFASVDGGDSFQDVFQRPIAFPDGRSDLRVQFSYPNGDFPIQVAGYGTIVGRLVPSGTPRCRSIRVCRR